VSRPTYRKLSTMLLISHTGLSPSIAALSRAFCYQYHYHLQALPISLATTLGISVDFFSCGYLDVSVLHVRFTHLCIQLVITFRLGFPIRKSADQSLFASSPQLIASYYVLHRL
jgi:hypothetical protein